MAQHLATELYYQVVETLAEMPLLEMASDLIHMILAMIPRCRCMFSSRAALKENKDKDSSIR